MVTRQLQVGRRTWKVRQSKTDVLPLCHATNVCRCTTTNHPLWNDAIIVLEITLLHSVSVIINFVIPKRDKQTKNITLFRLQPARDPRIPTILGTVIEEPLTFFDAISSFAVSGEKNHFGPLSKRNPAWLRFAQACR